MLEKQDTEYVGSMPCGVQEIIHGTYNQSVKKKDLIQYLFKGYMFDTHKNQAKLLRKYGRKYKNYFYDNTVHIDTKKVIYDLEHKSDLMLSKYVTSISINIPMEIIIKGFLYENKTYKQILLELNEYYKVNRQYFSEFSYLLSILNGNFGSIYQRLESHLRILTNIYEKFGPDFDYYNLIDRNTLNKYFTIPFYVYRTDNIAQNEGILMKIKAESIFSNLRKKFNVPKRIIENTKLTE